MPIDGLVSGLDTATIIEQLMKAERVPVDLMAARRTSAESAIDAYKSLASKLSAVSTASAALERSSGWKLRTATTTNAQIATATAGDGASLGALTFTVDRLTTTHGVATATNTAATTDVVVPGGTIQITTATGAHDIAVGSGSLAEVADAVNSANVGVKAAIVNTGSGYRLQLTASKTGASAAFSVTSGLNLATVVTTQGVDAKLTVGSGGGSYEVASATNTFTNILPGVSVTARTVSAEPVTVAVGSDATGLADKVDALVKSVNDALSEIKTRTAYDAANQRAASLAGDAAARRVTQALQRAVSDAVAQSPLGSPGLAGVALDRNGNVTFDRAKFTAAYESDPAAVERLFVQGATTTGDVSFVSAGSRTVAGAHNVVVTTAAEQANEVGMVGAFPLTVPATIRIKIGSTEVVYAATAGTSQNDAVAGLQAKINEAGLNLTATADGTGVKVTANNYGTAGNFQVDWGTGAYHSVNGVDAAGTIDGVAAVGVGRQLSIASTDGPMSGLSVLLTSNATGAVGSVNYEPGLAQRISNAVTAATDAASGYLTGAQTSRQSRIDTLTTSIDSYEVRLSAREKRLRAQFANLEVQLNALKLQSSRIESQIGSLSANSG